MANLMNDIRLAKKLFKEDRVTEAYYLLQHIEQFVREKHPEFQSTVEDELNSSDQISALRTEGGRIANLLALFEEGDKWNTWTAGVGTNEDVVMGIHKDEERGQYYIKVEGQVHCEMMQVLASLLENELYKYWMPLCTYSKNIATPTVHRRIVHTKVDFALLQKESVYIA